VQRRLKPPHQLVEGVAVPGTRAIDEALNAGFVFHHVLHLTLYSQRKSAF
jgi:hypothetical protein